MRPPLLFALAMALVTTSNNNNPKTHHNSTSSLAKRTTFFWGEVHLGSKTQPTKGTTGREPSWTITSIFARTKSPWKHLGESYNFNFDRVFDGSSTQEVDGKVLELLGKGGKYQVEVVMVSGKKCLPVNL